LPFAGDASTDPEQWIATLRSWMTIAIDHVIPGHGPVSGPGEIVRQLEFFEALKENTLAALQAGRGWEDIVVPPIYPVGDMLWFVEKTRQRWHAYYGGRS
jgi:glyoxylase-like metal-dependent hydrolase (beta-lactamase superfamily II)